MAIDTWPTEAELQTVLMKAQDVLERCSIPFIVLGSTAYQIMHDEPLHVPKIVLGVMASHAVPECTSLLKIVDPDVEMNMDGWSITEGSAKVVVKLITKHYPTLLDPDKHWYNYDVFKVPNPFEVYWAGEHYDI